MAHEERDTVDSHSLLTPSADSLALTKSQYPICNFLSSSYGISSPSKNSVLDYSPFNALSAPVAESYSSLLPPSDVKLTTSPQPKQYSRPSSLRSWSSTTQMTTVVTATGSTASTPTTHFPFSAAPGPVPVPMPGRPQLRIPNYRSTNTISVSSSASSWFSSQSNVQYGSSDSTKPNLVSSDRRLDITINVYDMLQDSRLSELVWLFGIGVYHSAVEVDGREYAYGGHDEPGISGVYYSKPLTPLPGGILCRMSISHGYTDYSPAEVQAIINDLSSEYMGTSYNLLYKNCNHFTNSLVERLTGKSAPAWLNRATIIGSAIPCIVPQNLIGPTELDVHQKSKCSPCENSQKSTCTTVLKKSALSFFHREKSSEQPITTNKSSKFENCDDIQPLLADGEFVKSSVVVSDQSSVATLDSKDEILDFNAKAGMLDLEKGI
ncbi:PPPDE putative peptidase domain-containing protein [Lipomyces arxii]|uniref:PPPDE putative peptidase domain-containing protein n=1 Tax=Lipomyces arxii TaxID=56418 RepID=UPI0034CEF38F